MTTKQRLRDRMIEDLVLRGMAPNTIASYVRCVRRFAEHFGRSPRTMGAAEIRAFLLHLVQERKFHPATFNVYAGALKFLYVVTLGRPEETARMPRMRVPMRMPVVLTAAEVARLLCVLRKPKLRVEDIDPKRMLLRVQHAKRNRERFVMLSPRLLSALRAYWKVARPKGPYLFPGRDPKKLYTRAAFRQLIVNAARRRASRNGCRLIRCATVLPRTCSRPVPISVPCRSCSVTPPSRARWPICT